EVLERVVSNAIPHWRVLTPPAGSRPIFQCADSQGALWFLNRDGRILRFAEGEFKNLPVECGLANKRVYTLVPDAHGRIWAGATNEIACWDGRRFQTMTPTNGEPNFEALLLFPVRDGTM